MSYPSDPYGGPPWPARQPGYGFQPPYGGQPEPDNYLVWAILSTLLCCLPAGVVSIVYSSKVSGLWAQGRYGEAQAASASAKKWAIISAVVAVVSSVALIIFYVVLGVLIVSNAPSTDITPHSSY